MLFFVTYYLSCLSYLKLFLCSLKLLHSFVTTDMLLEIFVNIVNFYLCKSYFIYRVVCA